MSQPLEWKDQLTAISDSAHKVYLANWETKTLLAENNGEFNNELHFRVLEAIEELATDLQTLAVAVEQIVKLNNLKTLD